TRSTRTRTAALSLHDAPPIYHRQGATVENGHGVLVATQPGLGDDAAAEAVRAMPGGRQLRCRCGLCHADTGTLPGRLDHYRAPRSEERTSELQSRENLVCRLL